MLTNLVRTAIIFITLVIIMRLMGKRQIGEMQPYEFIVTLIIADLACIPMSDTSIPLTYGIVSILGLFLLHQILSIFEQGGRVCKLIVSGKPSIVINKNGVDIKELKANNMGVEDLIESMRSAGYFSLDDVDYAIFESNGKLSTMANENRTEKPSSLPVLVVNEGKIIERNLRIAKIEKTKILEKIENINKKLKQVEVMTIDGNGRVYFKANKEKYKILSISIQKGAQW